jgi:hypothetical protein
VACFKYFQRIYGKYFEGFRGMQWKDDVENVIRKMGIVNWRHVVQDRDGWRRATMDVLILLG